MNSLKHIAVVILNYNSEKDLLICAEHIAQQKGVRLSLILVDNASHSESLLAIKSWLAKWRPDAICGSELQVQDWIRSNSECRSVAGNVFLILHHENRGYSAGNNIGLRVADNLGADAVLIANPDMRIEDPSYLAQLSLHMFSRPDNYIAASRIVGLDGKEQNPLREASFWEELFWPRFFLRRFFKPNAYVLPCPADRPTVVPKVSGCCLMLRMDFLVVSKFLDEGVFLYCEEPILSTRIRAGGGKIIFVPMVCATHTHVKSEKGDSAKRMLQFIESRKYYLKKYSGYSEGQLRLLSFSYSALIAYTRLKGIYRHLKAGLSGLFFSISSRHTS